MKVDSIKIKTFRGVRRELLLKTEQKESVLIYGDNGTGKSSLLDAIEWFIHDKISHLSGEEIKKYHGLRHSLAEIEDETSVKISFSKSLRGERKLEAKNGKLESLLNWPSKHQQVLKDLKNQRLWIRNNELIRFILKSKADKLIDISTIIGYDEVLKVKSIIKRSLSEIKKTIRDKNYQSNFTTIQKELTEKFGEVIITREQLIDIVNRKKASISGNDGITIDNMSKLESFVENIKLNLGEDNISLYQSFEKRKRGICKALDELSTISEAAKNFLTLAKDIHKDLEFFKNISYQNLYNEAQRILSWKKEDTCPLCLSTYKREELIKNLSTRLKELESSNKKREEFNLSKERLLSNLKDVLQGLQESENELIGIDEAHDESLATFSIVCKKLEHLVDDLASKDINSFVPNKFSFNEKEIRNLLKDTLPYINKTLEKKSLLPNSAMIELVTDIEFAKFQLTRLDKLKEEESLLKKQRKTLDQIVSLFKAQEKIEVEKFLNKISEYVDKYYLFMNPDERVSNIKLVPVETNEEFSGIALKVNFYNQQIDTPRELLSESHINCLGLSLFLASVNIFNDKSRFFVLDDVISSFDKPHRYRFGQLLQTMFSNYQIFVLTHEKEWFDLIAPEAKERGWFVTTVIRDEGDGAQIKNSLLTLREIIEHQIQESNPVGLGNLIRKYTETMLIDINENLEAPLPFRKDNKRSPRELYDGFRSKIKDRIESSLLSKTKKLESVIKIGNAASHASSYNENMPDLIAAYGDIESFENIFRCKEKSCKKFVSLKFYNSTEQYITCECKVKKLNWTD